MTLGQFADAERHFADAIDMTRRLESPPLTARAQCDYAELLLEREGAGDVELARQLSGESLATARQLGMKVLAERALSLKLRAQGGHSRGSTLSFANAGQLGQLFGALPKGHVGLQLPLLPDQGVERIDDLEYQILLFQFIVAAGLAQPAIGEAHIFQLG